ncbi:MAG: hypothetical protein HYY93_04960 [Planctomycetes bacterium]|nr:hypothetical protein [Planctomycetota bacterium]
MNSEDYTADYICRAMGLASFVEDSWNRDGAERLRILLMPSFDPEVCITLFQLGEIARMSVVVPVEMIWHAPYPVVLTTLHDEIDLPIAECKGMLAAFGRVQENINTTPRQFCLDGMPVETARVEGGSERRFSRGNPGNPGPVEREYLATLLRFAWDKCRSLRVKNALSRVARYVDVDLPRSQEPPAPPLTNLLVLGTEGEKQSFLQRLLGPPGPPGGEGAGSG